MHDYRGESQHKHLKSFIGHNKRKNSDFLNTCRGIERSVQMQIQQHRNVETQSKLNIPNRVSRIFNEVIGKVTWKAVDLVMEHRQRNPARAYKPCSGQFRREMGLPCAHDWERIEESDHQYFRPADFHRHWFWLSEKRRADDHLTADIFDNVSSRLETINPSGIFAHLQPLQTLASSVSDSPPRECVQVVSAQIRLASSITTRHPHGDLLSEPPKIRDERSLAHQPRSATGRILTANEASQRRKYKCSACGLVGHRCDNKDKCMAYRLGQVGGKMQPKLPNPGSDPNPENIPAQSNREPILISSSVNSPNAVEFREDTDRPLTPLQGSAGPSACKTLASPLAIRPSPKRPSTTDHTSPLQPEPLLAPLGELGLVPWTETSPTKPMHESRVEVIYSRYLMEKASWEARYLVQDTDWATYRRKRSWKVYDNILNSGNVPDPFLMRAKTMLENPSRMKRRDLQGNIIDPNPTWTDEEVHALADYFRAELRDADSLKAELADWGYTMVFGKSLSSQKKEAEKARRERVDNAIRAERRAHYITEWDDSPNRREDPLFNETTHWNRARWEYYVDTGSFPVS